MKNEDLNLKMICKVIKPLHLDGLVYEYGNYYVTDSKRLTEALIKQKDTDLLDELSELYTPDRDQIKEIVLKVRSVLDRTEDFI